MNTKRRIRKKGLKNRKKLVFENQTKSIKKSLGARVVVEMLNAACETVEFSLHPLPDRD